MARYIYEWKPTQHGRRLFRRPGAAAVAPAPEPETPPADLASLKKAELVEFAEERGVDSSGTKADIIARFESPADEESSDDD